ncbi:MAG: aminoglycoside phosphotransferase [Anaerolineae bacterium]|jgi:uncharacterized protein (TIGR02646 family)|nr:aminoglycoside phosphotransferase [Anaerolineae bacterium]
MQAWLKRELPDHVQQQLQHWQALIDHEPDFVTRVARAKQDFKNHNKSTNATFKIVRETLKQMCSGNRRCGYCEDSCADEIEHIYPKDYYPERTFVWENYLYICGRCNKGKNNRFAIFDAITGELIQITSQPPAGNSVLIDPRIENPMLFLELDLQDTYMFLAKTELSERDSYRAHYTIDALKLNLRDELLEARKNAYISFRDRVIAHLQDRDDPTLATRVENRIKSLKGLNNLTVWREMQRQSDLIPELKLLFTQAPEALTW